MGVSIFPAASSGISIGDVRTANSNLTLQQTITSTGAVSIPAGVTRVFAVVIGGGGSGAANNTENDFNGGGGGGAGGVSYGWTIPSSYALIGAGGASATASWQNTNNGNNGSPSMYGNIIASGGALGNASSSYTTPPNTLVSVTPWFIGGNVAVNTHGAVTVNNGASGGCGRNGTPSAQNGRPAMTQYLSTAGTHGVVHWGDGILLPGAFYDSNGPSVSRWANSTGGVTLSQYGYGGAAADAVYAAGGGSCAAYRGVGSTGGAGGNATAVGYIGGARHTSANGAVQGSGGGGAGGAGNGVAGSQGAGGAGGAGGGGGGAAGNNNGSSNTSGVGGNGCVLLYY
jgi:hypothetical protein